MRGYFVARFLVANAAKKTFRFTTGGESSLAVKPVRIFR